jgi:hypothetical protein
MRAVELKRRGEVLANGRRVLKAEEVHDRAP